MVLAMCTSLRNGETIGLEDVKPTSSLIRPKPVETKSPPGGTSYYPSYYPYNDIDFNNQFQSNERTDNINKDRRKYYYNNFNDQSLSASVRNEQIFNNDFVNGDEFKATINENNNDNGGDSIESDSFSTSYFPTRLFQNSRNHLDNKVTVFSDDRNVNKRKTWVSGGRRKKPGKIVGGSRKNAGDTRKRNPGSTQVFGALNFVADNNDDNDELVR